jgi:hypothetical protein
MGRAGPGRQGRRRHGSTERPHLQDRAAARGKGHPLTRPTHLDALTRELAEVQDALLALPDDAFAERHELLKRRDALREQAAAFARDRDQNRPTGDLLAELAALRQRLTALEADRIDLVAQAGGGGTGGSHAGADGWGGVALNQAMMDAQGAGAIRARIGRIKGILVDRGVAPDVAEPR